MTRPSSVPPPVTAVLDASSRWLPARLGEVEELLREAIGEHGETLGERRRRDPRGRRQAAAADARPALRRPEARTAERSAPPPRSSWSTWRPWSTTTSSTTRRCAAACRPSPPPPAATAPSPPATCSSPAPSPSSPTPATRRSVALLADASVALARGELAQRRDAFDLGVDEERYLYRCRLKTARLFECACLLGRDDEALREFGAGIGLAFQLLDDVLDVSGPPERTGKARGTDLLDGTVTLPLIEAAKSDPGIREVDLHALDAAARRGALRPDRRHRRPGAGPRPRPGDGRRRQARARAQPSFEPEQRQLLTLVADGVVQRYS